MNFIILDKLILKVDALSFQVPKSELYCLILSTDIFLHLFDLQQCASLLFFEDILLLQ